MNEIAIQGEIIRPFSPAIGKYKINENIINLINKHIDEILKDQNKIEELYNGDNLAGEIKYEIKINDEFLKTHLLKILEKYVFNYIKSTLNKELKNFEVKSSWVVCQFESDYNPIHWHNGHVSGVMYLKIPQSFGTSYKKNNKNGNISFIHGSRQITSGSVFNVNPKLGDFFIFPSYLMHTVYPFYNNEERRSLSFNAFIDKDIVIL